MLDPGTERAIRRMAELAPKFLRQLEKLTNELKRFNNVAERSVTYAVGSDPDDLDDVPEEDGPESTEQVREFLIHEED